MNFTLSSKPISETKADCLVVAVPEKGDWPASTTQANEVLGGLIKTLQKNGDATGKTQRLFKSHWMGCLGPDYCWLAPGRTRTAPLPTTARH